MSETCVRCGHQWCVSTPPRQLVLCAECARPTPQRNPTYYWQMREQRFRSQHWGQYGSPEWADARTSSADLTAAREIAEATWAVWSPAQLYGLEVANR